MKKIITLSAGVLLVVLSFNQSFAQTSWKGITSTNWATVTNWTAGVPLATTDVIIGDANFTGAFQPAISASSAAKSVTIGGPVSSQLTVSSTLTVKGDININSNGSLINGSASISLTGNWNNNNSYTTTSTNSTVIFNGLAQNLGGTVATTFRKLTIYSGSILKLNSNIFCSGASSILTVNGTLNPNESPSYLTTTENLTVISAAVLKVNAALFSSNYIISSSFLLNPGSIVEYAATSIDQTISSSYSYSTLRVNGAGTVKSLASDLVALQSAIGGAGNITVQSGTLDLLNYTANRSTGVTGGTISVSNGAKFNIGGNNTLPTGYLSTTFSLTSTVEYNGSNQAVAARTYGNLILSSSGGAVTKTMPVTAFVVSGSFSSMIGAGTAVSYTAASNINVNGTMTIGASTNFNGGSFSHLVYTWINNGTFTPGTSTMLIKGSGAAISGTGVQDFYHLNIGTTNVSTAPNMDLIIAGNLYTTGSGTFVCPSTGSVTMTGTSKTINGTGFTFNDLNVSGSVTTYSPLLIKGNISVSGSMVATTGTITMNGTGKTITNTGTLSFSALVASGSISSTSNFNIGNALNCTGSFSMSTGTLSIINSVLLSGSANLFNITMNGFLTLAGNSVMIISGAFIINSGTFNTTTNVPNTVNYNGTGAQSIKGAIYNNLILSNGSTKTAGAAITVNNTFTIAPLTTFDAVSFTHTVVGNWINNGTFTAGTSLIQFTGATNASITGATTFNNITINKSLATYNVSLLNNISVSTINMTRGSLRTGSNTLTITTTRTGNDFILGTITRTHAFVAATAYAFEGPNNIITFAAGVTGVTSITVNVTVATVADFPYGGATVRYYNITVPSGTYNATLRLHYEDAELNGNDESIMQLWKYNGTAWALSGKTANSTISNYVEKSGLTNITDRWSFTDDGSVLNWNGSVSSDWTIAGNWTLVQGTFSGAPASTDIVQLGVVPFTNPPIILTPVTVKSITFGSAQATTLTLNTGGSLTTNGSITGNWSSNVIHTINANNQNITISGNLALSDNTANHAVNLNIGTGIITVTGTVTQSGGANIIFTGAGTLNIGKDFNYSTGTFTKGTGVVKYTGSVTQTVAAVPYYNLTIIKTAATIATLSTATTIAGSLLVTTGELDINSIVTINGSVTISAGAVLDGNAAVINVGGNWTKTATGTFNAGNGSVNMIGSTTQTISAGAFNLFTVNSTGGSVVLSGNNTLNGDLSLLSGTLNLSTFTFNQASAGDIFTIADGTTLLVSGAANFPSNFILYNLGANSLVHYNGSVAQTVADVIYGNLSFSNGGALEKSFAGSSTINGNIIINSGASVNGGNNNIYLNGNWTNSGGTFTPATSNILLNGINKTLLGNTVFNAVTVNGSYSVVNNDMTFNGLFLVSATGSYSAGTGVATINNDLTNSGTLTSTGTTTFSGTALQTIRLINALVSTSTGIVNFNGSVSPVLNSTSTPTFATLNINNTAGINPSVNWLVLVAFNISSGASFNGGIYTHTISRNFTNNGTVTSSGILNFTPTSPVTLQLSGTSFSSTGSVIFGGNGAITITGVPTALQDVIIANTNAAGITAPSGWTINGKFSINNDAIFNAGSFSHIVAGDIESNGVLNGNTSTFTMSSANGDLSGSPGTVFNNFTISGTVTSNSDFNVSGDFLNNGTYDGSIGALIMTGSAPSVIGGTTTPSPIALLTINKTGGAVVTDNVNINNITALIINSGTLFTSTYAIAQNPAGGVIIIAAGGVLKLGGTNTIPAFSGYGFDVASTVEYAGTTQTIANGPAYGNLMISAAGNKTAISFLPLTVAGNFTITAGNFVANNNTHKIGGNWLMTGGTFNNTNSVIQFNGSTDQAVQTIAPFNSVNINKTAGAVTLSSDLTVNSILSFTLGKVLTGNFSVVIPSSGIVTGAAQLTGWVNGYLQKNVSAGASVSRAFEVGSDLYYSPATVLFASVTSPGNLIAKATANDHSEIDYSGLDSTKSVNRFWSLSNSSIVFTTASSTFNWVAADVDAGAVTANFKTASFSGGAWSLNSFASPLPTSIQATGLTQFGDFAIGERLTGYTWTGEGFTSDWNLPKNWSGGVPTTLFNTMIVNGISGGRFYPVLASGTGIVNNLTIQNASSLTVSSGKLQVAGAVTNTGILDASAGTIEYNGATPQTISSGLFLNNLISNLIISNDVSLAGMNILSGTLSVGTGKTFTTNNNLVLHSDALGTARIAALPVDGSGVATAFITGNVTIERYIPLRKAWRMLSAPVKSSGAPSINSAWQEGLTTSSSNPNLYPGYGVFITGGTVANGFDQGLTGATMIKVFNNATGSFAALPATGTNTTITNYPGYFLYIRGDRGINLLQGNSAAITKTTLRIKGQVNTGSMPMAVNATGYTIFGNPYPSAVDFESLTKNNVKNSFYVWDPKLSGSYGLGGYVTFSWNSGTSSYDATTSASPVSKYIPSGEAIIIESADGINPGTLTVKESDKTANGSDQVFGRVNSLHQQVRANLYSLNPDGSTPLLDGVLTTYDDDNSSLLDYNDAAKLNGGSENIGIKRDAKMLAIERRKSITTNDTTFLNIYQMKVQSYQMEIDMNNMLQTGTIAILTDSYAAANNNMLLDMNGITSITFNINQDPASYAIGRFSIVFIKQTPLPVTITSVKAYVEQNNIAVEWKTENEINISKYQVEKSADGRSFNKINSTLPTATNGGSAAYKILDTNPFDGNNYYRISSISNNGEKGFSNVVKLNRGKDEGIAPAIIVYPNPVVSKVITMQFNHVETGKYTMQLFNAGGQLVATSTIDHQANAAIETFTVSEAFAAGKYELKLGGKGIQLSINVIKR